MSSAVAIAVSFAVVEYFPTIHLFVSYLILSYFILSSAHPTDRNSQRGHLSTEGGANSPPHFKRCALKTPSHPTSCIFVFILFSEGAGCFHLSLTTLHNSEMFSCALYVFVRSFLCNCFSGFVPSVPWLDYCGVSAHHRERLPHQPPRDESCEYRHNDLV